MNTTGRMFGTKLNASGTARLWVRHLADVGADTIIMAATTQIGWGAGSGCYKKDVGTPATNTRTTPIATVVDAYGRRDNRRVARGAL